MPRGYKLTEPGRDIKESEQELFAFMGGSQNKRRFAVSMMVVSVLVL
jgi:hypothetical protein